MNISHKGLGELVTTFNCAESTTVSKGTLLKIEGGTVEIPSQGESFCGVAADDSRNNKIAVQLRGYAKVKFSGSPACGWRYVVVSDDETLELCDESTTNSHKILVMDIDPETNTMGILL